MKKLRSSTLPTVGKAFHEIFDVNRLAWLGQERVGSHFVGLGDVVNVARARKAEDKDGSKFGLPPEPVEKLKATPDGKLQVKKHDRRQRMLISIRERAFAIQVADRLVHVIDVVNRVLEPHLFQGPLQK